MSNSLLNNKFFNKVNINKLNTKNTKNTKNNNKKLIIR